MAVCGKTCLIVSSVIVFGLGYMFYTPLPDYLEQPWELRKLNAKMMVGGIITEISHGLGFDDRVNLMRKWTYKWAIDAIRPSDWMKGVSVTDMKFDGVPVRIYKPTTSQNDDVLPTFVYYHGGGWVLLDVESYDPVMAHIAREVNIAVVSVEYGLAPEHPFPEGFDDCVKATEHVLQHGGKYGLDSKRVAVGGDSAGGNLAAAVTIYLRDQKSVTPPKAQVLIYGAFQFCTQSLPMATLRNELESFAKERHAFIVGSWWNLNKQERELLKTGKFTTPQLASKCKRLVDVKMVPESLIQDGYSPQDHVAHHVSDDVKRLSRLVSDPRISPLLADDLGKLPTALVLTVQWDHIRDEGIIYGKRLQQAGNKVTWQHFPKSFHGVLNWFHDDDLFESGPKLMNSIVEFLKQNLK
ncbi:neutral cholesterol ester hydrolase 1-like [Gigantopelta aegis]|uniref:neutral cholesterol ester hydrolase 1-like n=1 Tax=Gigantopelta aegis TaxID=1735272 RepID=UPI001B88AB98|nr:neutral cholesterol ester hydrolase 1-like [Gigantopelta aegis]